MIDKVLDCFRKLDLKSLETLLCDRNTYQETTKEIFLKKIFDVFKTCKDEGDTELIIYDGVCCSKKCDNTGKKGYRFVGNHSKNNFSLIFEIEDDEVKDIYQCHDLKTDANLGELPMAEFIRINYDERSTFFKTAEYSAKVEGAERALAEIIQDPPLVLDFEDVCDWLEKHHFLNKSIGDYCLFDPKMKWTPFSELYADFTKWKVFIWQYLEAINQLNLDFKKVSSENELINWVIDGETVYDLAPFDFRFTAHRNNQLVNFDRKEGLLFTGKAFIEVFNFIDEHQKHQDQLFTKYNTFTREDMNQSYKMYPELTYLKLSFHIEKRKTAEELGIEIPLYIKN